MIIPRAARIFSCLLIGGLIWSSVSAQTPASFGEGSEGTKLVTRSALGAWMLREDPSRVRLNCAVRFIPAKAGVPGFAIFGPTANSNSSAIIFNSSDIPSSGASRTVQIALFQQGLPTTQLNATILPRQSGAKDGTLVIGTGDIRQTMNSIRDSERNMQLLMDSAAIATLSYDGFDLARNAMLGCLDGKQFAGKTLAEATAEIRPLGKSTINGQVFYKGALLARKQYPKQGSQAVGLIWMTDEFKAWYEQVKRDKKLPSPIPERILKHFMSTRILDDKGNFTFTNLPAGEFLLIANYSYEKTVTETEVVGRTDTYIGNQHIGSTDNTVSWSYVVQQGTSYGKSVIVPKDGNTIQVSLDKSKTFCFLVCF